MIPPSEFLECFTAASTRDTYKIALTRYLEIIRDRPLPKTPAALDTAWENYLTPAPDLAKDIPDFISLCQTKHNFAPKTICLYTRIIHIYLRENDISPDARTRRICKNTTPKNRPVTRETELTRPRIKTILKHADTRMRAELLILISSGMRIGELLSFTIDDINLTTRPAEINLKETITKNKTARTVFISREAEEALRSWLPLRPENYTKQTDTRCFPYTKSSETARFRRLLKTSRLYDTDHRTGRSTIHFHLFRKYFLTEFKLAASAEAAEHLAGHEGYLSSAYRRLSEHTLKTEYKKAEPHLTISEPPVPEEKHKPNTHTPSRPARRPTHRYGNHKPLTIISQKETAITITQ